MRKTSGVRRDPWQGQEDGDSGVPNTPPLKQPAKQLATRR